MEVKIKLNGKDGGPTTSQPTCCSDRFRPRPRLQQRKARLRDVERAACARCCSTTVPVLSCSTLAARADGRSVCTLEGLQAEASEFVGLHRRPGRRAVRLSATQALVMNTIALLRENPDPTDDEILAYLQRQPVPLLGLRGPAARHPRLPGQQEASARRLERECDPNTAPWPNSVRTEDSLQLSAGQARLHRRHRPRCAGGQAACEAPTPTPLVKTTDTSQRPRSCLAWSTCTPGRTCPTSASPTRVDRHPETSPYDRLIIDRHVRFVGDVVAIVAAEN